MASIAIKRMDYIDAAPLFDGCNDAYNLFLLSPLDDFVLDDDHQLDMVLVTIQKVKDQLLKHLDESASQGLHNGLNTEAELQLVLDRLNEYDESLFVNIL